MKKIPTPAEKRSFSTNDKFHIFVSVEGRLTPVKCHVVSVVTDILGDMEKITLIVYKFYLKEKMKWIYIMKSTGELLSEIDRFISLNSEDSSHE